MKKKNKKKEDYKLLNALSCCMEPGKVEQRTAHVAKLRTLQILRHHNF